MKKMTKGVDVIIHTACTAYEGLSVFSPYLVGQNTYQISMSTFTAAADNGIQKLLTVQVWLDMAIKKKHHLQKTWSLSQRSLWYYKTCFRRDTKSFK